MRSPFVLAAVAALSLGATPAFAQATHGHGEHDSKPSTQALAASAAVDTFSQGTVRKVDAAANKLTIAHGPLENLAMPSMTMAFVVADTASIEGVSAGDKIRFVADRVDGVFIVVKLERAN